MLSTLSLLTTPCLSFTAQFALFLSLIKVLPFLLEQSNIGCISCSKAFRCQFPFLFILLCLQIIFPEGPTHQMIMFYVTSGQDIVLTLMRLGDALHSGQMHLINMHDEQCVEHHPAPSRVLPIT